MAGYMDGTINVWKTELNTQSSSAVKKNSALKKSSKLKIKHIMEMTLSSHILKLELVKANPYDMLLILGSDFQITVFALMPKKPKKVAILGSKYPIVDFNVIEYNTCPSSRYVDGFGAHEVYHDRNQVRQDMGGFRLLAIDNRTNIIEFGMLRPGSEGKLPKYGTLSKIKSGKTHAPDDIDNKRVEIE